MVLKQQTPVIVHLLAIIGRLAAFVPFFVVLVIPLTICWDIVVYFSSFVVNMSRPNTRELDPLIDQFQHLSAKRRGAEALQMLRKIASMVKPIMRQRNWRVGTLAEFYPSQSNLLGLNTNRGDRIDLRLRHAGDESQFLPFEEILDTMLHELCHIVQGPHNQHFYALWAKLRDEQEALIRKGYTGEGFLGKGERLGGQRIPMHEMRRRARVAAEQRAFRNKNSGSKLGGVGILRGQDVREVIAAAAEKRAKVERGCANGTEEGRKIAQGTVGKGGQVITTRAEQEDENEAAWIQAMIELVQEEDAKLLGKEYVGPMEASPTGVKAGDMSTKTLREEQANIEQSIKLKQTEAFKAPVQTAALTMTPEPDPDTWTCEICTLINPIEHLMCGACDVERPSSYSPPAKRPAGPRSRVSRSTAPTVPSTSKKHPAFQPRLSAHDSIARIDSQAARKADKPLGWTCHSCGNWMEEMWWTCASCGQMKASSS